MKTPVFCEPLLSEEDPSREMSGVFDSYCGNCSSNPEKNDIAVQWQNVSAIFLLRFGIWN